MNSDGDRNHGSSNNFGSVDMPGTGNQNKHVDDIIQFEDDQSGDQIDQSEREDEEAMVNLADLPKQEWRNALRKYDINNDGKLSGSELMEAYPDILALVEKQHSDGLSWWPDMTVMTALVLGGAVILTYALWRWMEGRKREQPAAALCSQEKRENWLRRLEQKTAASPSDIKKDSDPRPTEKTQSESNQTETNTSETKKTSETSSATDFPQDDSDHKSKLNKNLTSKYTQNSSNFTDTNLKISIAGKNLNPENPEVESTVKLQKRKQEESRNLVTTKMAKYQQLSAVRRKTGNEHPVSSTSESFYQQLLSDDDEDVDSSDEIIGNTRKRRQQSDVAAAGNVQQKISRDENNDNSNTDVTTSVITSGVLSRDDREKHTITSCENQENNQDGTEIKSRQEVLAPQKVEEESVVGSGEPEIKTVPAGLDGEAREKVLIEAISHILNCTLIVSDTKRVAFAFQTNTLRVPVTSLPVIESEIESKLTEIVKTLTVRQVDKVKFAIGCFDRWVELAGNHGDPLIKAACDWLSGYMVNLIHQEVTHYEDSEADIEEDLWSDYVDTAHGVEGTGKARTAQSQSTPVKLLWSVAGWSDDGIFVSHDLLAKLLKHQNGDKLLVKLLQATGQQLKSVRKMDEIILQEGRTLRALEILLAHPSCMELLTLVLEAEVKEASSLLGNYFEQQSVFGPLLSLTSVPSNIRDPNLHKTPSALPFMEMQGFPRLTETDVRQVETSIQEALIRCQNIVFTALKKVLTSKAMREKGLSWLSALINLNDVRTSWSPQPDTYQQFCCTDGYMLNASAVLIELFLPAINTPELLSKIDLRYSASTACRINYDFEICLAGGQIVSEKADDKTIGPLAVELQGKFNFLTECYHLTQRILNVGILPSIAHYNRLNRDFASTLEHLKGTPQEEKVRNTHVLLSLMWDTSLLGPELVRKVTQFYLCQSTLLLGIIEEGKEEKTESKTQKLVLSKIPEFCIKDMAIWFRFLAQHAVYVRPRVLQGLSLSPFVDCCVTLLERPDLMPGPLPASKIVSALLAFVRTTDRKNVKSPGWGSNVLTDLALMVHTCPSTQEKLGPALVRTYVSVDVVEGLDVDKDEFDKYSSRLEIAHLIQTLWEKVDSRTSILQHCHTALFQTFLGAILDTLLYMLHDSLARLANVRKMEIAKDDEEEWRRLSEKEKADKERFLKNEEHTAKSFMYMANETLKFVDMLTKAEEVASCFTRSPLTERAASAILGFLESLCGSNSKDFKVKNMEKYNFDPQSLLSQIVKVIVRISTQDVSETTGFVVSMATDADFSPPTLERSLSVITRKQLIQEETVKTFERLIGSMKVISEDRKATQGETLKGDNSCTDWQTIAEGVEIDRSVLKETYKSNMESLRFDTHDLQESHSFHGNTQDLDGRSAKVKTLMKEMKQLQQNLPVDPDAAIFVRQDEDRMDLMRAMVTGPVDTPYSLGCFLFDVYFPSNYPTIPPLVKSITTGNGTVRFNPNLYPDGKVCLSLLGTWHAGDASEKWIPSKSSLYQVLVSIQALILIPDPMFNEPGYEGMREAKEGLAQSQRYNSKIRLWTIRHAMLAQLRNPPVGFEDLIRRHFTLQREAVLKQCCDWLRECEDEEEGRRLRTVVDSLRMELDKLITKSESQNSTS